MTQYEIKANVDNTYWEDVTPITMYLKDDKKANEFCTNLAEYFKAEIRLNKFGSHQGVYFFPKNPLDAYKFVKVY